MYEFFDDTYVYGPLTQEEFETVAVNHRLYITGNDYYIGVSSELPEFTDRHIVRPIEVTNPNPSDGIIEGEYSIDQA